MSYKMHPKVKAAAMQMFNDKDNSARKELYEAGARIRALEKENKKLKAQVKDSLAPTAFWREENEKLKKEKDVSVRRIEYYEKYIDEHIDTQEWVNFVEKYSKTDGIVLFGFEGDEESESEEEEECHTDDWNNPCPICKDIMGGIVCNTFGQESCGECAIKIMADKKN